MPSGLVILSMLMVAMGLVFPPVGMIAFVVSATPT